MEIDPKNMQWINWPHDVPYPIDAEYEAAKERYLATISEGDYSDYALGYLGFVMATYNRLIWWPLFFPEQEEKCRKEFNDLVNAAMEK